MSDAVDNRSMSMYSLFLFTASSGVVVGGFTTWALWACLRDA